MPAGVKTRAQRRAEEKAGAPASPIRYLPLTRPPRAPRARKPTARNATRECTPTAASGSEADRSEKSSQPQEPARAQSVETEDIVETVETQEHVDTAEHISSEIAQSSLDPNQQFLLNAPGSSPSAEASGSKSGAAVAASRATYRSASPSPSPSATVEPQSQNNGTVASSRAEVPPLPVSKERLAARAMASAPPAPNVAATPSPPSSPSSSSSSSSSPPMAFSGPYQTSMFSYTPKLPLPQLNPIQATRRPRSLVPYMMAGRGPAEQHAVLHLWVDATRHDLASDRPSSQPTMTVAVPYSRLGEYLKRFAAQYPGGNVPQTLTTSTATQTVLSASKKRKATDDTDDSRPSRRVRFNRPPIFSKQAPENSANQEQQTKDSETRRIVGYRPAPLYNAEGMLRLGQPDTPVYSDDEEYIAMQGRTSSKEDQVVHTDNPNRDSGDDSQHTSQPTQVSAASQQALETPGPSRWTFGSILDSASKYVPGLGRRTAPTTPAMQRPITATSRVTSTPQFLRPQHPRTEPRVNTQAQHSRTEPRVNTQVGASQDATAASQDAPAASQDAPAASQDAPAKSQDERPVVLLRQARRMAKAEQQAQSNKVSKTQQQTPRERQQTTRRREQATIEVTEQEKARNRQVELDRIAEQKRMLEEEQKRIEDDIVRDKAEKALKATEEWRAEKKANPGLKRKRPASPEVIPNPKGCSFGFDPRYFVVDSSSDEEPTSPTPPPSATSKRLKSKPLWSAWEAMNGPKVIAQPYTGAFFAEGTPTHQGGNVFGEIASTKAAADKASAFKQAAAATPKAAKTPKSPPRTEDGRVITNLSGHFTVPDDDTEDDDSDLYDSTSPTTNKTVDKEVADVSKSPTPALPTPATTEQPNPSSAASAAPSERQSQLSSAPAITVTAEKAKAPTWSQPPPAPPSPSHATLPAFPLTDSESLNAARAKALKHAPKKPSSLRESSRINSSPVAPVEVVTDQPKTPAVTPSTTRRASSDEIIAQMESDVANNPPPPLKEILGVLADKAPNGQVKVSCQH